MSQFLFRKIASVTTTGLLSRGRYMSSFPQHIVVGMPALSPTMTSGTIGKWTCKVGDKISPGDSLAEVETDKASVTFEAQDEFVVAKILIEQGAEVKVGDPIMVTVEEAADVAAFANFSVAAAPAAAAAPAVAPAAVAPPTPAPVPTPKPVEAPKAAPVVAAPAPTAPTAPTPAPKAPETPKPAAKPAANAATFLYGSGVLKGALVNKLVSEQQAYVAKYGRSANAPIKVATPSK